MEAISATTTKNLSAATTLLHSGVTSTLAVKGTKLRSLKTLVDTASARYAHAISTPGTQDVHTFTQHASSLAHVITFLFRIDELMTLLGTQLPSLTKLYDDQQQEEKESSETVPTPPPENPPGGQQKPPSPTVQSVLGIKSGALLATLKQLLVTQNHPLAKSVQDLAFDRDVLGYRDTGGRILSQTMGGRLANEVLKLTLDEVQDLLTKTQGAVAKIKPIRIQLGTASSTDVATFLGIPPKLHNQVLPP